MALYDAPDVASLSSAIRRALRDADGAVFEDTQIIDFMNIGLGELSLIRPVEIVIDVVDVDGLSGLDQGQPYIMGIAVSDLDSIWAIELVGLTGTSREGYEALVPINDPSVPGRNGWDFVAGVIELPYPLLQMLTNDWASDTPTYKLRVKGYHQRRAIRWALEDLTVDLHSLPEEEAVITLAQRAGFMALANDRALFQQWMTATNATDVSETQLNQMIYAATQAWERARRHLAIIRRQPMGMQ